MGPLYGALMGLVGLLGGPHLGASWAASGRRSQSAAGSPSSPPRASWLLQVGLSLESSAGRGPPTAQRPRNGELGCGLWSEAPPAPVLSQCFGKPDDSPASGLLMIIIMAWEARSQGSGVGTGALGSSWLCQDT